MARTVWRNTGRTSGALGAVALVLCLLLPTAVRADFESGWIAFRQGLYEDARDAWTAQARAGDLDLQFNLGTLYEAGYLGDPDYERAAEWYEQPAARDLPAAMQRLGEFYARGLGVEQDLEKAVALYRAAAETGYAPAQFSLAVALEKGIGVSIDTDQASVWYNRAANQGLAAAQYNLGRMFIMAEGAGNDPEQAIDWYRKAAEGGLAEAQNNLGLMYENGTGVAQDDAEAVRWYTLAADQGLPIAQNNLGVMYHYGRGVPRDTARAAAAYYAAAIGGNPEGQTNLAFVLANGVGVEQNLIDAYAWILIARVGDDPVATAAALEYGRRLFGLMSVEQRKAGLERADILRSALEERPAGSVRRLAPMRTDDMGSPTAAAQRYLRQYGFLDSAVDGVNGRVTSAAISVFQQRNGLPATGIANADLIAAMAEALPMPWDAPIASSVDRRP